MPTVLKHCMCFCEPDGAKLLSVGIDYGFNNCIDIFFVAEVKKIKPINMHGYSKLHKNA